MSPNEPKIPELTEAILRRLYQEELRTDAHIAAQFGVTDVLISLRRKKWGIPSLTARQRRELQTGRQGPTLDGLTASTLADLYQRMGDVQIAKMYGVAKPAIKRLRQQWGIAPISKSYRSTRSEDLTDEQKETILGIMLGDGHLLERGVFKVWHSNAQYEYLCHIHDVLKSISRPIAYYEKVMEKSGELTMSFGFFTVQHAWLRAMRGIFYPDGKERTFPETVLLNLTPRSLAYWYFDDGHLADGQGPTIALGKISDEVFQRVCDGLTRRFGLLTKEEHRSTPSCRVVEIRLASAASFFGMVRDFATPDLLYKIPPKYWKSSVQSVSKYNATKEEIRVPVELVTQFQSGNSIEEVLQFWRGAGFPYHIQRPEHLTVLSHIQESQVLLDGNLRWNQVGQSSCQAFMPHIWKARSWKTPSPWDLFHDDTELRKILEIIQKREEAPNASNLRTQLRRWGTGVFNFRPSVAKILVDRFCVGQGVVFDPCAGWGGRLLGTLLSNTRSTYVACEPSTETVEGLHALTSWIGQHVGDALDRVRLHAVPAEEFIPGSVDMVLTSPPYWRREIYAQEITQSSERYPTYSAWLGGFWGEVLARSIRALKRGGHLVLNVDDFELDGRTYNLIADTKRLVRELGLGDPSEEYKYLIPSAIKDDNFEMVLVWSKNSEGRIDRPSFPAIEVATPTEVARSSHVTYDLQCQEPSCRKPVVGLRSDRKYCSEACAARHRRAVLKTETALDTLPCQMDGCTNVFLSRPGKRTKICETCQAMREDQTFITARTKACGYRACGESFVDYSPKNISKFCCEEHRRREKQLRMGYVSSPEGFRFRDPVLGDVENQEVTRTCSVRECRKTFKKPLHDTRARCPECRDTLRNKVCQKEGCQRSYRDESEKNTRRYCHQCSPELAAMAVAPLHQLWADGTEE